MKTPKQRLVAIVQKNIETKLKPVGDILGFTEDQLKEFVEMASEQNLAAEIVTNAYVLNFTDEELEEYATLAEKLYSFEDKTNLAHVASESVINRFIETNTVKLTEMVAANTTEQ